MRSSHGMHIAPAPSEPNAYGGLADDASAAVPSLLAVHSVWRLNRIPTLKIIDFGLSNMVKSLEFQHTPCGSPHYVAPEVLRGTPTTTTTVHVAALLQLMSMTKQVD